jgi:hypothetical protein
VVRTSVLYRQEAFIKTALISGSGAKFASTMTRPYQTSTAVRFGQSGAQIREGTEVEDVRPWPNQYVMMDNSSRQTVLLKKLMLASSTSTGQELSRQVLCVTGLDSTACVIDWAAWSGATAGIPPWTYCMCWVLR